MGEKRDDGLEGREGGGVPVIGYAPVVESRGWGWRDSWGIGRFLGGGLVLGVVVACLGMVVEVTGNLVMCAWIVASLVIGLAIKERPYFKSAAASLGLLWGEEVSLWMIGLMNGKGADEIWENGLAFQLVVLCVVGVVVSLCGAAISVLGDCGGKYVEKWMRIV